MTPFGPSSLLQTSSFDRALPVVLRFEGGWSNNAADPGGATMKGVTQKVYDAYRRRRNLAPRPVKQIGNDEVAIIYREMYWSVVGCEDLPGGYDLVNFDAGVNSGPARARNWRMAVPVGPVPNMIKSYCAKRMSFVQGLRTFKVFGKGWSRRIADIEARAVAMYFGAAAVPELKKAATDARNTAGQQDKAAKGTGMGGGIAGGAAVANDHTMLWVALAVIVVAGIATVVWWKGQHNRERAAAFDRVAAE